MTPAARVGAAIDVLDRFLGGTPAEQALTNWARGARYAGSKDRAAVRDLVFGALRRRRSCAWLGGTETGQGETGQGETGQGETGQGETGQSETGQSETGQSETGQSETGRALMIGYLRRSGIAVETCFTGEGYAPSRLSEREAPERDLARAPEGVQLDLPDWLLPEFARSLGPRAEAVAAALAERADIFLRANLIKGTRDAARSALAEDGIAAVDHELAATALKVKTNPRRVRAARAYLQGLVELQDAASQAAVEFMPSGGRVLDFCAGGGGKALALAALGVEVFVHDAAPERMGDLHKRAARAGVKLQQVSTAECPGLAPFDLVLCDVPCSGSGAWRRSPEGKWSLTQSRLDALRDTQRQILDQVAGWVAPGGALGYVTCSLLQAENQDQVATFLAERPDWRLGMSKSWDPTDGGDGFFAAVLFSG